MLLLLVAIDVGPIRDVLLDEEAAELTFCRLKGISPGVNWFANFVDPRDALIQPVLPL